VIAIWGIISLRIKVFGKEFVLDFIFKAGQEKMLEAYIKHRDKILKFLTPEFF